MKSADSQINLCHVGRIYDKAAHMQVNSMFSVDVGPMFMNDLQDGSHSSAIPVRSSIVSPRG